MESDCQTIKHQFASAANSLSELFQGSVNLTKNAYFQGKVDSYREISEIIAKAEKSQNGFDVKEFKDFVESRIKDSESAIKNIEGGN